MNLKKILVVLNGFIHDFAACIWLAAITTIALFIGLTSVKLC